MNTQPGAPAHSPSSEDGLAQDDAPSLLYNLVYCSRAAHGVDEADVVRIVATARRFNPQLHITGMLVFGSGIFFQWLEGPRAAVLALMDRLRQDPRHRDLVQLSEDEEVRERVFPEWDMEWVEAQDIRGVLADALYSAQDPAQAATLKKLLGELDAGQLQALEQA